MPMFSAMCYAMIPIINRRIGLSEHAITMALYTTAAFVALCLLASLVVYLLPWSPSAGFAVNLVRPWRWLSGEAWLLVAGSGVAFTVGLLGITHAYRVAIVSAVAPFEYSYLIWASLLGFIVFGDVPGMRTVLGSLAVVACGLYVLYRERRTRQ